MSVKTPAEIEIMREGGRRLATILNDLASKVAVGVTPKQLAQDAAEQIKKNQMQAVVLGYDGFPDVICISVNEIIVHGIPTNIPFADGDVVKLDLTLGYKGLIVDSALTVIAGQTSKQTQKLVEATKKSLYSGIDAIKGDGTRVGDIASVIQKVLEDNGLGVIQELVGHGVGHQIHEEPNVPNYGLPGTGPILHTGMTIAVEPMASLGDWPIKVAKDGQSIAMKDGSLGAHFEHTVLITENGAEILTQS